MSVTIYPFYSSDVDKIKLDYRDDQLNFSIIDNDYDELVLSFDSAYFGKHLKIVSRLHNRVELEPIQSSNEFISKLMVSYKETDDVLSFIYNGISFEISNDEFNEIIEILL